MDTAWRRGWCAMSARARLPNRRASTTFTFDCGPHRYVATVSYFPGTDRLAEIFLGNGRAGSDIDAAAKDSPSSRRSLCSTACRSTSSARRCCAAKARRARRSAPCSTPSPSRRAGDERNQRSVESLRTSVRAGAAKSLTSGFACTFRDPPMPRCGCTQAVSASSRAASWKACR